MIRNDGAANISEMKKRVIASVFLTVAFIVGSVLLWALPLPAINVYYKVAVSSAELETKVRFHFDSEEMYEGSSTQEAYIENDIASIRLDPLNAHAKSLTITVAGNHPVVHTLKAEAQVTQDKWVEAATIPQRQMKVSYKKNSHIAEYCISGDQIKELDYQIRKHSLIKPIAQILCIALFLIVLLRGTICRNTKALSYYGGVLISLMLVALLINVWVVKPSASSIYATKLTDTKSFISPISYSDSVSVVPEDPFVLHQELKLDSDEVNYIQFPVIVTGSVKPDDDLNSHYSEVYKSPDEFTDRYVLSIRENGSGRSVYSGMVTPRLLNDDLNAIIVPVHLKNCANTALDITLKKVDRRGVTGLAFEAGVPSRGSDYLRIATKSEQREPQIGAADESSADNEGMRQYSNKALETTLLYKEFPYKIVISLIVVAAVALIVTNFVIGRMRSRRMRIGMCAVNYGVLGVYACGQSCFYRDYIGGFPDEQAHISYVAYLASKGTEGQIIPDFSAMRIYTQISNNSFDLSHPMEFNYLGHPPFFYYLLRFICRPEVQGSVVTVNINAMRWVSFLVALTGIAIACYIGFTRLPKNPILQLLYGLILISPPNLIYVVSGVSNDSLTIFSVALFMLGIVRFYERRYGLPTYVIIAAGICGSVLAKLTAGMIVCVIAVLVVAFTLLKERDVKAIFNWRFLVTIPIYAIPAYYFAQLYTRFGTIQPNYKKLAEHEYMQSGFYSNIQLRGQMGVWEYICYYFQQFMGTWNTLAGHIYVPRGDSTFTSHMGMSSIALTAILAIPVLIFVANASREASYLRMLLLGVYCVFLYQMLGSGFMGFNVNGYKGGYSSRYYLCAVPLFAIAIMYLIIKRFAMTPQISGQFDKAHDARISPVGEACCMVFALLLVVDGFVYSVLMDLPQSAVFG